MTGNKVGSIIYGIGVLTIAVGVFAALICWYVLNFGIALICFFSAFISGMLFIGFGEIIKLLQQLVDERGATNSKVKVSVKKYCCSDCGEIVQYGIESCPKCGRIFDWSQFEK